MDEMDGEFGSLSLLPTEPYRPAAIRVASGNLFLRAEIFDVVEVGGATKEQVIDHHLARDVLSFGQNCLQNC